jgi:hypothetical protein
LLHQLIGLTALLRGRSRQSGLSFGGEKYFHEAQRSGKRGGSRPTDHGIPLLAFEIIVYRPMKRGIDFLRYGSSGKRQALFWESG